MKSEKCENSVKEQESLPKTGRNTFPREYWSWFVAFAITAILTITLNLFSNAYSSAEILILFYLIRLNFR